MVSALLLGRKTQITLPIGRRLLREGLEQGKETLLKTRLLEDPECCGGQGLPGLGCDWRVCTSVLPLCESYWMYESQSNLGNLDLSKRLGKRTFPDSDRLAVRSLALMLAFC